MQVQKIHCSEMSLRNSINTNNILCVFSSCTLPEVHMAFLWKHYFIFQADTMLFYISVNSEIKVIHFLLNKELSANTQMGREEKEGGDSAQLKELYTVGLRT